MLTARVEMCIGNNNMVIPYKIDTRSDGNIMSWYIFKKILRDNIISVCENH